MSRRDAVLLAAILLLALGLRVRGVHLPPTFAGEEPYHVPGAKAYLETGVLEESTWSQPQLAPLLLGATIAIVGDDPWGWRLRNVVLGSLTVLAVALLARALFPDRPRSAWTAALLFAVDPLHVLLSRSTGEEIQAACFFTFAAWLVVRHLREGRPGLVGAGVLLGAAHATKGYYHLAGLLLLGTALVTLRRRGAPTADLVHAGVSLVAVPAAVYLAVYLPWFGRGHGLVEFVELQRDAARHLAGKTVETFANGPFLSRGGSPASWFLRPTLFGMQLRSPPGWLRTILFAKNPIAWAAVLPAVALLAVRGRTQRDGWGLLLLGLFAATYLPLLALRRPVFLYSAVAVLPLGFLAVGRALATTRPAGRVAAGVTLALALTLAAFLYPLATGIAVPESLYGRVVSRASLAD